MSAIQAIGAVALLVPLLFLMPVRALVKWFAIWGLYDGYTPLADANAHTLGGHALTIYAAWKAMDHDVIPPAGEGIVGVRLLAAAVVGSAMGAFFRGAMQVLDMLMTNPTLKDFAIKLESDQWPHQPPPPPLDVDATRLAPWSASERGVAIRMCKEPGKGEGVFASRPIPRGTIVGVWAAPSFSSPHFIVSCRPCGLWGGQAPRKDHLAVGAGGGESAVSPGTLWGLNLLDDTYRETADAHQQRGSILLARRARPAQAIRPPERAASATTSRRVRTSDSFEASSVLILGSPENTT